MEFTDDRPRHLMDVRTIRSSLGPVTISNHSELGFNIRHFYQDWQTGAMKATQKGVAFVPADLPTFLKHLEAFINEHDVLNGRTVTITIEEASDA